MREVIDQFARELCALGGTDPDDLYLGRPWWMEFRSTARDLIRLLRDPTDEMLDAGAKHINPEGPGLWIHKRTTAGDLWSAMIDELLREQAD